MPHSSAFLTARMRLRDIKFHRQREIYDPLVPLCFIPVKFKEPLCYYRRCQKEKVPAYSGKTAQMTEEVHKTDIVLLTNLC